MDKCDRCGHSVDLHATRDDGVVKVGQCIVVGCGCLRSGTMATFMEAMLAARDGKKVRAPTRRWVTFVGGILTYADSEGGTAPLFSNYISDYWEIYPDPPREYDFMEAVEMMEKGKKIKSLQSGMIHWWNNGYMTVTPGGLALHADEIKGKWVEVSP